VNEETMELIRADGDRIGIYNDCSRYRILAAARESRISVKDFEKFTVPDVPLEVVKANEGGASLSDAEWEDIARDVVRFMRDPQGDGLDWRIFGKELDLLYSYNSAPDDSLFDQIRDTYGGNNRDLTGEPDEVSSVRARLRGQSMRVEALLRRLYPDAFKDQSAKPPSWLAAGDRRLTVDGNDLTVESASRGVCCELEGVLDNNSDGDETLFYRYAVLRAARRHQATLTDLDHLTVSGLDEEEVRELFTHDPMFDDVPDAFVRDLVQDLVHFVNAPNGTMLEWALAERGTDLLCWATEEASEAESLAQEIRDAISELGNLPPSGEELKTVRRRLRGQAPGFEAAMRKAYPAAFQGEGTHEEPPAGTPRPGSDGHAHVFDFNACLAWMRTPEGNTFAEKVYALAIDHLPAGIIAAFPEVPAPCVATSPGTSAPPSETASSEATGAPASQTASASPSAPAAPASPPPALGDLVAAAMQAAEEVLDLVEGTPWSFGSAAGREARLVQLDALLTVMQTKLGEASEHPAAPGNDVDLARGAVQEFADVLAAHRADDAPDAQWAVRLTAHRLVAEARYLLVQTKLDGSLHPVAVAGMVRGVHDEVTAAVRAIHAYLSECWFRPDGSEASRIYSPRTMLAVQCRAVEAWEGACEVASVLWGQERLPLGYPEIAEASFAAHLVRESMEVLLEKIFQASEALEIDDDAFVKLAAFLNDNLPPRLGRLAAAAASLQAAADRDAPRGIQAGATDDPITATGAMDLVPAADGASLPARVAAEARSVASESLKRSLTRKLTRILAGVVLGIAGEVLGTRKRADLAALGRFLEGPVGRALLQSIGSLAVEGLPLGERLADLQRTVAHELRVEALAGIGDVLVDRLGTGVLAALHAAQESGVFDADEAPAPSTASRRDGEEVELPAGAEPSRGAALA
jgi:hypothetical protein